jgi:hypothetical protein
MGMKNRLSVFCTLIFTMAMTFFGSGTNDGPSVCTKPNLHG